MVYQPLYDPDGDISMENSYRESHIRKSGSWLVFGYKYTDKRK